VQFFQRKTPLKMTELKCFEPEFEVRFLVSQKFFLIFFQKRAVKRSKWFRRVIGGKISQSLSKRLETAKKTMFEFYQR
jgi:hypothetical protein